MAAKKAIIKKTAAKPAASVAAPKKMPAIKEKYTKIIQEPL